MKTPEGILTIPAIYIADIFTGANQYVFFPMSALLSEEEQGLFELYRAAAPTNNIAQLEQDIMFLLEKLAIAKENKPTIQETNNAFAEIEEICRSCWTIKKISIEGWKFVMEFDWRVATDSDWYIDWMVLPPLKLFIDLRNFTVRWDNCYHPHILSDYSLCMGWDLTDLAQKCIRERDLKTLIAWMISFWNTWTSDDVWHWDRHPSDCIMRYVANNDVDWNNIPVTKEEIDNTLKEKWWDRSELGSRFVDLFDND